MALTRLGYPKADISIMNSGGLRGNLVYEPGKYLFTLMWYKVSKAPYCRRFYSWWPHDHFAIPRDRCCHCDHCCWYFPSNGNGSRPMAWGHGESPLIIHIPSSSSCWFYRCSPAISGFRVSWDSSKQPGQRVQGIWLLEDSKELGPDKKPILVDKEEIFGASNRELVLVAAEYVAEGGDGYNCLTNKKVLISTEGGQIQSSIVRQNLLGE